MKIVKEHHSLQRHQHWIMGFLWLLVSIFHFRNSESGAVLASVYLSIAVAYSMLQFYYYQKGRAEVSISWNENEVVVQELFQRPKVYNLEDIESITITGSHLILKNKDLDGIYFELKGFSEDDINVLRSDLAENDLTATPIPS